MAEKPINTLPALSQAQLSVADFLIGHTGDDPEGFRATLAAILGDVQSNARGSSVRLANGLQLCWHYGTYSLATGGASDDVTWEYPRAFSSQPTVIATGRVQLIPILRNTPSSSSATFRIYNWQTGNWAAGGTSVDMSLIAVGRWR